MKDVLGIIADLRRPRLLIEAAQHGCTTYRRERDLHKFLKAAALPRSGEAIMRLLDIEGQLNAQRHSGLCEYSVQAHVEIMIAILAEARLLRGQQIAQM